MVKGTSTVSEAYNYNYDGEGKLLTDGRSKYKWNNHGQLNGSVEEREINEMLNSLLRAIVKWKIPLAHSIET